MALATINSLIGEALDSAGAKAEAIRNVVVSGNTIMAHLLLQIEPRYLRRDPYIPTVTDFPILKAGEIGLKANPMSAVFIMPGPASYVGGDIVSGILYTGFHREDPVTLFIDIGTNGEIVLGNKEWLMTAACSAGPAFEGGGIRWGMRAEEGAIEKAMTIGLLPDIDRSRFSYMGNSSIVGAYMALLSTNFRQEARMICDSMIVYKTRFRFRLRSCRSVSAGLENFARKIMAAIIYGLKLACL